jgi:hypothetical protein
MCTEASTILRAVAVDFFNCLYLEIPSDNHIRRPLSCARFSVGNVLEFLC